MNNTSLSLVALSLSTAIALAGCNSTLQTMSQVAKPLAKEKAKEAAVEKAVETAVDSATKSVVAAQAEQTTPQAAPAVAMIKGDFDSVVVPGKAMKGRFGKKPYPDVVGDTRKWVGVKKVSIPRYIVNFDKKAGESASASTGWTGPNANTHVHAQLEGIEEATFARITEKAYADFEQKMRAAGYEVIPKDTLVNTAEYQTWSETDYPKVGKGSSKYLPQGMRSFSKFKQYFRHGNLMNETQAALVEPTMMVNFAAFGKKTSRQSGFQTTSASAEVTMGTTVHVSGSLQGTTLKKCDKRGQCFGDAIFFHTGQVSYSMQPFGKIADTTSKGAKAVQGALNALARFSGTSTRSDTKFTVTGDNSAYEAAALDALYQANTKFVNKLVATDKT